MQQQPDKPWLFRTYAGHSTAEDSNALFRTNLAKGQTGLSIAFDLPTQMGYDADHPLARGEVGKLGVPVSHLGDMRTLLAGIQLDTMNVSMTINATAAWLLALIIAVAEEQGIARAQLAGTTQNDIIKEYLSRGTYVFPPQPSLRLTTDIIAFTTRDMPKWNPMNVCSYHLQEAGATPVQELAFALANAVAVLDAVKPTVSPGMFPEAVGRISFFVNAGIRFITEMCKMRAFTELWDELLLQRYGITEAKHRRFRYGVQVNSLGLTEQQPENNVYRILLEMLAVVLSRNARARAVQLPAWNEALGLPRPFDQQWSIRLQQIVAYETDLLSYGDIFDGSKEIARQVNALKSEAMKELNHILDMGGAVAAVDRGYMKKALVASNNARLRAVESGEMTIVGVNRFQDSEPSILTGGDASVIIVPEQIAMQQVERLKIWKAKRDSTAVRSALSALRAAAAGTDNIMPASILCAKAGVTTGEWATTLRELFGEYRAPTGVMATTMAAPSHDIEAIRARITALAARDGRTPSLLLGKPGLDGHSNGAEQLAIRAAECGFEVTYDGIRLTAEQIIARAQETRASIIGLSILSGSHVPLAREVMQRLRAAGLGHIPVVAGGIVPEEDKLVLKQLGVTRVYTPKDYDLNRIMSDLVGLLEQSQSSVKLSRAE